MGMQHSAQAEQTDVLLMRLKSSSCIQNSDKSPKRLNELGLITTIKTHNNMHKPRRLDRRSWPCPDSGTGHSEPRASVRRTLQANDEKPRHTEQKSFACV